MRRALVHVEVKKHSHYEGTLAMKKICEEIYLILLADRYYPLEDKVSGLLEESVRE